MAISAQEVKKLKDITDAGLMDCKKALEQADGNMDEALKVLKEKGLADAKKRSDRDTSEGGIYVSKKDNKVAMALISCETDFVSNNELFISVSNKIAEKIVASGNDQVNAYKEDIQELISKTKENIILKKAKYCELSDRQYASTYIHSNKKIGVITIFDFDNAQLKDKPQFSEFANNVSMHIAANAPAYLQRSEISQNDLDEQAEIFKKQLADSGKPENIIENIVKGKISKHCSEICLLEQKYVKDDKLSVQKYIDQTGQELGSKISVKEFVFYKIGA